MEILRDFSAFENNQKSAKSIIDQLENDKKELNKQIHIFKVLDVCKKIQDLFNDNEVRKEEFVSIKIRFVYDRDYGNQIKYTLKQEEREVDPMFISNNLFDKLEGIFRVVEGFNLENISEEFKKPHQFFRIDLDSFKESFTNLMLSNELKKVLNYSRLENDLPTNNKYQISQIKKV